MGTLILNSLFLLVLFKHVIKVVIPKRLYSYNIFYKPSMYKSSETKPVLISLYYLRFANVLCSYARKKVLFPFSFLIIIREWVFFSH